MQELQQKQQEWKRWKDEAAAIKLPSTEDKIEHYRFLEYKKHAHLFCVGYSTLHKAGVDGSVTALTHHLNKRGGKEKKVKVDDYDKAGHCAIHYAAERGHADAIEFIVKQGCDVDVKGIDGKTALMCAASYNQLECIEKLMEMEARLWLVDNSGLTALYFAAQGDHHLSIELMLRLYKEKRDGLLELQKDEEDDKKDLLMHSEGMLTAVNLKKDTNDDMSVDNSTVSGNSHGKSSTSALKRAEAKGSKTAPKGDKKAGDKNGDEKKEKKGRGPKGKTKAIETDEIADRSVSDILNMRAKSGMTVYHCAASYDSLFCLRLFAKHSMDPNLADAAGETPMHKAGRMQYFSAFRMIKENGGAEHLRNNARETPLGLLRDDTNVL